MQMLAASPDEATAEKILLRFGGESPEVIKKFLRRTPVHQLATLPDHALLAIFSNPGIPITHWLNSSELTSERWRGITSQVIGRDLDLLFYRFDRFDTDRTVGLIFAAAGAEFLGVGFLIARGPRVPANFPFLRGLQQATSLLVGGLGVAGLYIGAQLALTHHENAQRFREQVAFLKAHPEIPFPVNFWQRLKDHRENGSEFFQQFKLEISQNELPLSPAKNVTPQTLEERMREVVETKSDLSVASLLADASGGVVRTWVRTLDANLVLRLSESNQEKLYARLSTYLELLPPTLGDFVERQKIAALPVKLITVADLRLFKKNQWEWPPEAHARLVEAGQSNILFRRKLLREGFGIESVSPNFEKAMAILQVPNTEKRFNKALAPEAMLMELAAIHDPEEANRIVQSYTQRFGKMDWRDGDLWRQAKQLPDEIVLNWLQELNLNGREAPRDPEYWSAQQNIVDVRRAIEEVTKVEMLLANLQKAPPRLHSLGTYWGTLAGMWVEPIMGLGIKVFRPAWYYWNRHAYEKRLEAATEKLNDLLTRSPELPSSKTRDLLTEAIVYSPHVHYSVERSHPDLILCSDRVAGLRKSPGK
jgi:hypothetical protein